MAHIGSWWLAKHAALADEIAVWSALANHTQSANRAVGGKLFVTNKRLLFSLHLFDHLLGGRKLALDVGAVWSVGKREKGGDTFGGGLRDRLQITLQNGDAELFVVNKLEQSVAELQSLLHCAGRQPNSLPSPPPLFTG
jgi:hypothetical protein